MIPSVLDLLTGLRPRPVCVVGKGPTFDRFRGRPQNSILIAINQAAVHCPADFAFVTDLDVLTSDFFAGLPPRCTLVLPYYPHIEFKPRKESPLPVVVAASTALSKIHGEERLATYASDRWPASWDCPRWPRIRVKGFTAVAVLWTLYAVTYRTVWTAGVDGGSTYHNAFSGLTPLTNGQKSYKVQDRELALLARAGFTVNKL